MRMRQRWSLVPGWVPGCIPAMLALAVSGVEAASLDRAGTWTPGKLGPALPPALRGGGLINDGSFELGPPPASAWTEVGNPACVRIGDFSGVWYVSAFDGTNDYWAGGYCDDGSGDVPVNSSVTQTITIPAETPQLSFYYIAFRPDADDVPADGDHAYVAVNGAEVWTLELIRANDTYPNWSKQVAVDLSAYAGQSVALMLGNVSVGNLTGNVRFDFIELTALTPVEPVTWGRLKGMF